VIARVFLGAIGKRPSVAQSNEKVPEISARDEERVGHSANATATPPSTSSSVDEHATDRVGKAA
jgi:hypothetical protein